MGFVLRDATAEDYPAFAHLFPALGVKDRILTPAQFSARMLPGVAILEEAIEPIGVRLLADLRYLGELPRPRTPARTR